MTKTVTVGGEERVALVLPKSWNEDDLEEINKSVRNALLAVSVHEDSKDALTSTSMYFLLKFMSVLEEKEGGEA